MTPFATPRRCMRTSSSIAEQSTVKLPLGPVPPPLRCFPRGNFRRLWEALVFAVLRRCDTSRLLPFFLCHGLEPSWADTRHFLLPMLAMANTPARGPALSRLTSPAFDMSPFQLRLTTVGTLYLAARGSPRFACKWMSGDAVRRQRNKPGARARSFASSICRPNCAFGRRA
jgi:hypothetical protein